MQCYASLTAEVCLESENLLRSYHLRSPSLPPSYLKDRDRLTSEPEGIYLDFIKCMETAAKHKPLLQVSPFPWFLEIE